MDDALPPGNGVMVRVLATLGHLFGETRYRHLTSTLKLRVHGALGDNALCGRLVMYDLQ